MSPETQRWTAWLAAQGVEPAVPPCPSGQPKGRPRLIVARRDPRAALAAWAGAWTGGWDVFLADPAWPEAVRREFSGRVGAHAVSADAEFPATGEGAEICFGNEPIVAIPTGGSSGAPKLAVHSAATLSASARAGVAHLGGGKHQALSLLPVHHVSGLMPTWRAAVFGGTVRWDDWKSWRGSVELPQGFILSLVPTQLAQLREKSGAANSLRQAGALLLGGAAADPALLAWARAERLPLAPCYGMTETAAFVACCLPGEFASGADDVGRAVPGASFSVSDGGRLSISSPGLFLGYWPERREAGNLLAWDFAELSQEGRLKILGRLDDLITCGGEKASPGRIEACLRSTGLVQDVAVWGEPDPVWGARVVAAVVLTGGASLENLDQAAATGLPPWERPRRWLALPAIPRTEAGKVDRARLRP